MNTIKKSCAILTLATISIASQAQEILFNETFSNCLGKGGNDNLWNGSIASSDFNPYNIYEEDNTTIKTACSADNEGWTIENGAAANNCIKLGKGSALGQAQTPMLTNITEGDNTLTFRAGAWDSSSESTKLNITITGENATLSIGQVILVKGSFSTYTIKISGATKESQITFSANVKTNNRFFIDDITITSGWSEEEQDETIDAPTFSIPSEATITEGTKISLSTQTNYSIYYTTDGTEPSKDNGTLYTDGIIINTDIIIKAIAVDNEKSSEIATAKYYIKKQDNETPELEDVEAPVFSVAGGLFGQPITLEITAEEGCTIRYTTDGTEPTAESKLYDRPITVDGSCTLRAIAFSADGTASDIAQEQYYILESTDSDMITFSQCGYDNAQAVASAGGLSEVVAFSSVKGTKPAYYNTGSAVRIYSGSSLTVSSIWDIIAVEIKYAGASYSASEDNIAVEDGTQYDFGSHRWSIGGKTATLTYTATSGNLRIVSMKFIYAIEKPEIETKSGTIKAGTPVEITYSPETEVYYTLDGTEPTINSLKYSEPIVVNNDMTIKAVAVDVDGNYSEIVTAEYNTYNYTTIADAKMLAGNSIINLYLKNAIVTKVTETGLYVTDENGSIYIESDNLVSKVSEGYTINGTIEVEYTNQSGKHTVTLSENTNLDNLEVEAGEPIKSEDVDFYDVFETDYTESFVNISGYVKAENTVYYIVEDIDDDISYGIRINNEFGLEYNLCLSEIANVTGIIRLENDTLELLPMTLYQDNTPIRNIKRDKPTINIMYNLLGQQVDNTYKGIIIKKGKKFVSK